MKRTFILLITLLLLTGCKDKIHEETEDMLNNIEVLAEKLNVYEDYYLYDIIDNHNFELITENDLIDTDKVGNQDINILYKVDKKTYSHVIKINVVDEVRPYVFSGTNKTVELNYAEDLCNVISYGDNYDKKVKCEIIGDYDLSKVGSYKLIYNLTDSSNNLTEANVTLNVVEKIKKNPTTPHIIIRFEDFYNEYKTDNNELGIDVSKWQGEIDFNKVKEAGASFVMMRIGVQTETNGEIKTDSYFDSNFKKAKEAGLKIGLYLYSISTTKEDAIKCADWIIEKLNGEKIDLGIAFDWENWSKWNSLNMSFHDASELKNSFIERINNAGYTGMLYGSKFYLTNLWIVEDEPIWLAHYTEKTTYEGKYVMWQRANNGRIPGIYGDVDLDILYTQ